MEVSNPQTLDHIIGANGNIFRCKMVNIPPWDMDADRYKDVTHGLTAGNIISVFGRVVCDAENIWYNIPGLDIYQATYGLDLAVVAWYPTTVGLWRLDGGLFDHVNFDRLDMDRGFLWIWYFE